MHLDPDLIRPVLCQARCSETIVPVLSPIGDKNAIVFIVRKVSNWTQNVRHGGQIGRGKTEPMGSGAALARGDERQTSSNIWGSKRAGVSSRNGKNRTLRLSGLL